MKPATEIITRGVSSSSRLHFGANCSFDVEVDLIHAAVSVSGEHCDTHSDDTNNQNVIFHSDLSVWVQTLGHFLPLCSVQNVFRPFGLKPLLVTGKLFYLQTDFQTIRLLHDIRAMKTGGHEGLD